MRCTRGLTGRLAKSSSGDACVLVVDISYKHE